MATVQARDVFGADEDAGGDGYWTQEPVATYSYGTRHADNVYAGEVVVYDDREGSTGQVKVQVRANGPLRTRGAKAGTRRRRVAVLSFDGPDGLAELAGDLLAATEALA